MRVYVGTSGYNYTEWRGTFYPDGLSAKKMFGYYSERFSAVEINYSFYRVPTTKTAENWRAQAPEGFRYALKTPRRITHDRRLQDCEETLGYFCESARLLGPHLGPLLVQLPPSFRCDIDRLRYFLQIAPHDMRLAFEFRHDSWLVDEVYGLLERHGAALCIADSGTRSTPVRATARHGYFRLRDEGYSPADLERWAATVAERHGEWNEVFVFFKHEDEGKGPEFAAAFRTCLGASSGVSLA